MLSSTPALESKVKHRPRVLVVDDEQGLLEVVSDVVGGMDCHVTVATSVAQAKRKLIGETFELLVTDVMLPDGDGTSLLSTLRRHQPTATAIVITGNPSVDGAISALRSGAVDFVPKPFNAQVLIERVRRALDRQTVLSRQEKRLVRLRDAVKKLGVARRTVSQKVDLLCNDLVSAYGELSRQLDLVRTQENFRKHIHAAADLEQLLCHTMDWLLRQLGNSNVAIWLAGDDGAFQLGAYMKHTIPGDDIASNAMLNGMLPGITRTGFSHVHGETLRGRLQKDEFRIFSSQDIIGLSATYLGEPLAVIVLFRDINTPFGEADESALKSVAAVFATALAAVVRDPNAPEGLDEGVGDGAGPFADDEPRNGKKDKSDWWKRGEPPPF
jgi:FixJ family two-component response regulator